jgi:hypothetical protein
MKAAGLEIRGFVGIHLSTGAPGLPAHEPAVLVARDLHATRCLPLLPPGDRVATASMRKRKHRNRPQPLPQRTTSKSKKAMIVRDRFHVTAVVG